MSTKPSPTKDLILLFAIPIGIAILAAAIIYTPRLFANPKYDFIYSLCDDYDCRESYSVDATRRVSQKNISGRDYAGGAATIRYYDADTDATRSLTLEEAQRYRLDTSSKSPDGYSLSREDTGGGFLFWGDDDEGWYLKKGLQKKSVELSTAGSYYSRDINFLGWVEQ